MTHPTRYRPRALLSVVAGFAMHTGCGRQSVGDDLAASVQGSKQEGSESGFDRGAIFKESDVRYPEGMDFILIGGNYSGLMRYAKKETIRICLSGGLSQAARDAWAETINDVTKKWLDSIRPLTFAKLADGATIVTSDCYATVLVQPQNNAYTLLGTNPRIVVAPSGYFGSYNVVLHEFGHAFGLGDTYQNGQSGNCRPGQPQAVMCNTSFDHLQPDDLAGMKAVFKMVYPNDTPNTMTE